MINVSKVKKASIRSEEGTIGGTTYHINTKDGERAWCFRQIHGKPDMRCTNAAGFGTDHVGTGACKFHGGNNSKHIAVTSARWSKVTQNRLRGSIEHYMSLDRSKLLDLAYELAVAKSVFDVVVDSFPQDPSEQPNEFTAAFSRFVVILDTLTNTVERISRVENRNTITAAQVLLLRATVADILMKYLPDPKLREKAARELASRMGGDIQADLQPIEVQAFDRATIG